MVIQKQLYTVDDFWELANDPDNENKHYELIDGELFEMSPPGRPHGKLAATISRLIGNFVDNLNIGEVTVQSGYSPPDRPDSVLSPDVAYLSQRRIPDPEPQRYTPVMPDLVVEIQSPSNSMIDMKRKAAIYIQNGTRIVWVVRPFNKTVEVIHMGEGNTLRSVVVSTDGTLSGEDVLPGFELPVAQLFPSR